MRASWPSPMSWRAQWCDALHASRPTRQGGSLPKKSSTSARRSLRRSTTVSPAPTPWTWKTFLAMSRPILTTWMVALPGLRRPSAAPMAPAGAEGVHPIWGHDEDDLEPVFARDPRAGGAAGAGARGRPRLAVGGDRLDRGQGRLPDGGPAAVGAAGRGGPRA